MSTTIVLPTRSNIHTQRSLATNITKSNLNRKPVQLFEYYYIPTITLSQMSIQQLLTQYYHPTRRGKHYYETTDIFHDDNYYYNNDYETQWF